MNREKLDTLRILPALLAIFTAVISEKAGALGVAFFLLFLVISQLSTAETLKNLWLSLETILLLPLFYYFPTPGFFLLAIYLIDLSRSEITSLKNLFYGLTALALFVAYTITRDLDFLVSFCYSVLFGFLVFLSRGEALRKQKAQELYDKIRETEDELRRANEQLRLYADSVEEITSLRERTRIAREVHDSAGHALSTIHIQLQALETLTEGETRSFVSELRQFSKESLEDVRSAVHALKPARLEGLESLQALVDQERKLNRRSVNFQISKNRWSLSEDHISVLYRSMQEFFSNTEKHTKASKIDLTLIFSADCVHLTMSNDGEVKQPIEEGFGLRSMRERAEEFGGSFRLSTADQFTISIALGRNQVPYRKGNQ